MKSFKIIREFSKTEQIEYTEKIINKKSEIESRMALQTNLLVTIVYKV